MVEEAKTEGIQEALAKRKRWTATLDVSEMFGHDGAALPKVTFRILTKSEDRAALTAAHAAAAALAQKAGGGASAIREDEDFLRDFKTTEALWRAIRKPDNTDEPAFITPEWMSDALDTDQLSCLLNLYLECRKRRGPLPPDLDSDRIDAIRDGCVTSFDSAVPEIVLAAFDREYLTAFIVLAMKQWHDERARLLAHIVALEEPKA